MLNEDFKIEYINERTHHQVLGYTHDELIGDFDIKLNHPEDYAKIRKFMLKLFKNKEGIHVSRMRHKSGNYLWFEVKVKMFKDDQGNQKYLFISRNITERRKTELALMESEEKYRNLYENSPNAVMLISRVSHELKTPITSIVGGAQILLELYKDQTCSDALEFIEMINRGGKRLKILIENLLDASRIESEKLKLNLQKENIVDVVKNCVSENRYLANKRNIILELSLPEVINIEIDKIRIEQVFTNLLTNAIKNTPKKGIIRIKLREKGNSVYFTIKDKGIGLTEKEMEKLFTKFGKIERYGQKMDIDIEGSGLGLYISKEIVDLHGGRIWVESEGRNEGSTFYIKLFKKINDLHT